MEKDGRQLKWHSQEYGLRRMEYGGLILWLISLAMMYASTRWYYLSPAPRLPTGVSRKAALDYNSPVYKDIDIHLDNVTPDSTLWSNGSNVWREDPSPETDAAWESLVKWNPFLVSKDDLENLGLSTEGSVRWPDDPTGRTYVAQLDIFHLLHCVNELRKGMWFDYYEGNKTLSPAYWVHKKHCADVIRQEIMCTGSLNVYRLIWEDHQSRPFPNFTINRKCRRWEDILDWQEKHQLSDEDTIRLNNLRKPDNEVAFKMPPVGIRLVQSVDAWLKKLGIDTWKI